MGQGNERLLKWVWSTYQDCHAHIWLKPLKIFFSRTEDALGLNLCTNIRDLFMVRSSLLPYAFVWAPYICMRKMLRISNDFSSEKRVREKSWECHNHKPQPFSDPKRKRKPTNLNKHKPNKRTKSTKISSLFPK